MTDQALDGLLRQVLLDADGQEYGDMMELLPEHDFSPDFERKMKKLIRRANHPIRHRVAQAAACFLLAALLSGCTVLAISPEARAAFVGWVREVSEGWFVYHYTGEDQAIPSDMVYRPTWIPEGYHETTVHEDDTGTTIIYENEEYLLLFKCIMDIDAGAVYIGSDNIQNVKIGDSLADLYIDPKENAASAIVWTDENGNLFWIHGNLSGDELIKMAESIEAAQYIGEHNEPFDATYKPS